MSPILEYRLMGRMQVALGCRFALVAMVVEGAPTAAVFGTVMYLAR